MFFKNSIKIGCTVLLFACSNENVKVEVLEEQPAEVVEQESEQEQWTPQFEVLPSCEVNIKDSSFQAFYESLLRSCLDYDSLGIVAAIHDSVRFSQYECYDQQFLKASDCENCFRCSKEGIIKGVFGNMDKKQMADYLFHFLTYYGIAPYQKENGFMLAQPIQHAYCNFNFKDQTVQKEYFDYGYILPKQQGLGIYTSMDLESERIGEVPYEAIPYINEVGMGAYNEINPEQRWLAYNGGYVLADEVTTGFDYTFLLFEKTHKGWRITGFFQPPGC